MDANASPAAIEPIDLNALVAEPRPVRIGDRVFRVRQITYGDWKKIKIVNADPSDPSPLWEVAHRLLIDCPPEIVDDLTPKQAWTVIAMASGMVTQVEERLPNTSPSPAAATPTGEAAVA